MSALGYDVDSGELGRVRRHETKVKFKLTMIAHFAHKVRRQSARPADWGRAPLNRKSREINKQLPDKRIKQGKKKVKSYTKV